MVSFSLRLAVVALVLVRTTNAFAGVSTRPFTAHHRKLDDKPKLILITGSPGTGKSTFGMSVALDQGILKCISTDTVRAVMRSFVREDISPALHRSSYAPSGDNEEDCAVKSWIKTCTVLAASMTGLIDDAIARGQSLVLEGVHVVPSRDLIERWEDAGGNAIGCVLVISDEEAHKGQLRRRGVMTGKGDPEEKKIKSFSRIRSIQDEMIRLAHESNWLIMEQNLQPDPLDEIQSKLMDPNYDGTENGAPTLQQQLTGLEQHVVQADKEESSIENEGGVLK